MSGVSLPVNRPIGRALIVGSASTRGQVLATLQRQGYTCAEADDPYAAMADLCRRPLVYRVLVLSLAGIYREELLMLEAIHRRLPHVEVWLADTDGRQSLLTEAISLGAVGLVCDDGFHRISIGPTLPTATGDQRHAQQQSATDESGICHTAEDSDLNGDAILTADELRALLYEVPVLPNVESD